MLQRPRLQQAGACTSREKLLLITEGIVPLDGLHLYQYASVARRVYCLSLVTSTLISGGSFVQSVWCLRPLSVWAAILCPLDTEPTSETHSAVGTKEKFAYIVSEP